METILTPFLTVIAALICVPVGIFFAEVMAAVAWPRRTNGPRLGGTTPSRQPIAVMIPAHNEGTGLLPTLADLKGQMHAGDRLLVIADNCTDDTAEIALAQGAEVIERRNLAQRGKGYALDFGVQHLKSDPPDIVIMVDADCRLAKNAIDQLVNTCSATYRPVQALYLMMAPTELQSNYRVAEFAWRVKNWLRPSGLAALQLPCQLVGTGMAFPWDVIRTADLASGSLVEDIKLGLDLAAGGHPPVFCPSALVTSQFAPTAEAARTQRERWETGHLYTIATTLPQLFCRAVLHCDWKLLALTLDLAVPPLSLLAILVAGVFAATGAYRIFGYSSAPLDVSSVTFAGFLLATCIAWLKCGRDVLPLRTALSIGPYIVRKIVLHGVRLFKKGNMQWVRTDRAKYD